MKIFDYPLVDFPTIIDGFVDGPIRWQSLDGEERFDLGNPSATQGQGIIKNQGPVLADGKLWGITHIQKKSTKGWLRADPFCWHWWDMPGLQKQREDGSWIPGTEDGWSARTPGWRWQPGDQYGNWVFTKGRLAKRWD